MFKTLHKKLKAHITKDNTVDEFDGIYPFELNDLPLVKYKSFGEENPDKVFFVIYRKPNGAGFFSNFTHVALFMKLIEGKGYIPVVDFENFNTFYNTENPINGTKNAWEYYFYQPSGYSLDEVYRSKNVLFCDGVYPFEMHLSKEDYQKYYNMLLNLKPDIKDTIAGFDKVFEGNKVLGVHFRGKDLNFFPNHSFGATTKQMFKNTDEIIKKFGITKIFIATDEKAYLESYIEKYGDMVFYADNFRTKKINEFNINPRENHRYLLGKEVLVDMLLLSKSYGILSGPSHIPALAKSVNPNFKFHYFIDNGKNSRNKYFAKYLYSVKKHLPKWMGGLKNIVYKEVKEEI